LLAIPLAALPAPAAAPAPLAPYTPHPTPPPPPPSPVYVFISHRLFLLTNAMKDAFIPHDNNRVLGRNCILLVLTLAACTGLGLVGHTAGMMWLLR
jgi:hypothetical protein